MKYLYTYIFIITTLCLNANGVAVVDAQEGTYLTLLTNNVTVEVDNQIALVKNYQTFKNTGEDSVGFKFAYPLKYGASAIELRWNYDGEWNYTKISPNPQDTSLPGGGSGGDDIDYDLEQYLGEFAVYLNIPQKIAVGEIISVELTYVEFLSYSYGEVYFHYNGDYAPIQIEPLVANEFQFDLKSERTIESLTLLTDMEHYKNTEDHQAVVTINSNDEMADYNVDIVYKLSLDDLGLFGMSTFLDDEIDSLGQGYFMFVAEPDDGEGMKTLHKNFVLVIDESGSMGDPFGSNGRKKIFDAMETAHYIVDNLNSGDYFNIVTFDNTIKHFRDSLIEYNEANRKSANQFIDDMVANNGTLISGSLVAALDQFTVPDENFVNIMIFFTDGLPSEGIKDPSELSTYIKSRNGEKNVQIYPFGIGDDVNKQLLGLLADENDGTVAFLENNDITESITQFYNTIRSPLLINAQAEYDPDIVTNTVPAKLPNLYKGSQMIVAGRYNTTSFDSLDIKLKGTAYSKDVEYNYKIPLASEEIEKNGILPKIWAKLKINDLFAEYYRYNEHTDTAKSIKEKIKRLSVQYGILTEFTSFVDNHTSVDFFSFNGYKTEKGIELFWNTSYESNIQGFYVERRNMYSGENWQRIGFVSLNDNSNKSYMLIDENVKINTLYQYRINQVDLDGTANSEIYSQIVSILYDNNFSLNLMQNYPNPVIESTTISFFLPKAGDVKIEICDTKGQIVDIPFENFVSAGKNQIVWSAANLPAGTYFYRLFFKDQVITKSLTIN